MLTVSEFVHGRVPVPLVARSRRTLNSLSVESVGRETIALTIIADNR